MTTMFIFFADQQQCAEWDAQLLADHPSLERSTEEWRTQPGWHWRCEEQEGGPFETREECEADARRARAAPDPHEIADVLGDLVHGLRPTPRGRRRWH
jgi:hypothetical protein